MIAPAEANLSKLLVVVPPLGVQQMWMDVFLEREIFATIATEFLRGQK